MGTTWIQLTATSAVFSNVNCSVGLGSPPGSAIQGTAAYSNFQVRPFAPSGTWTSAAQDWGGIPPRLGAIHWDADVPSLCSLTFQTRSSPDGQQWSDWSAPYANGDSLSSPPQRYIQVQAVFASSDPTGNSTPVLRSVSLEQPDFGGSSLLKAEDVKVLPNPIKSGQARVQWMLGNPARSVTLEFSGPTSRRFLVVDAPAALGLNQYSLDCSRLANDVYFVKVRAVGQDGNETDVVKKLLVSR